MEYYSQLKRYELKSSIEKWRKCKCLLLSKKEANLKGYINYDASHATFVPVKAKVQTGKEFSDCYRRTYLRKQSTEDS